MDDREKRLLNCVRCYEARNDMDFENKVMKYLEMDLSKMDEAQIDKFLEDVMLWKKVWKRETSNIGRLKNNIDWLKLKKTVLNYFAQREDIGYHSFFIDLSQIKGMGNVYAITILFFVSQGKLPMYDRFADMGLYSYINNFETESVELRVLSDRKPEQAWEYYSEYMEQLNKMFEDRWIGVKGRAYDRALWAYGHSVKATPCHKGDKRFEHF